MNSGNPDRRLVRILNYDKREEWEKQEQFLENYRRFLQVNTAAVATGIKSKDVYKWLKQDEKFVGEFEAVYAEVTGAIEDEAVHRAVFGEKEPVFFDGVIVGYKQVKSDALLKFLLQKRDPNRFGDKVTGESGTVLILPSNGREVVIRESDRGEIPKKKDFEE